MMISVYYSKLVMTDRTFNKQTKRSEILHLAPFVCNLKERCVNHPLLLYNVLIKVSNSVKEVTS